MSTLPPSWKNFCGRPWWCMVYKLRKEFVGTKFIFEIFQEVKVKKIQTSVLKVLTPAGHLCTIASYGVKQDIVC